MSKRVVDPCSAKWDTSPTTSFFRFQGAQEAPRVSQKSLQDCPVLRFRVSPSRTPNSKELRPCREVHEVFFGSTPSQWHYSRVHMYIRGQVPHSHVRHAHDVKRILIYDRCDTDLRHKATGQDQPTFSNATAFLAWLEVVHGCKGLMGRHDWTNGETPGSPQNQPEEHGGNETQSQPFPM